MRSRPPARRSRRFLRGPEWKASGSTAKQAGGGELAISRLQRIFGECREDVGEEQLLVLLLVIDAELDQLQRFRMQRRKRPFERFVDMAR